MQHVDREFVGGRFDVFHLEFDQYGDVARHFEDSCCSMEEAMDCARAMQGYWFIVHERTFHCRQYDHDGTTVEEQWHEIRRWIEASSSGFCHRLELRDAVLRLARQGVERRRGY